METVVVLIMFMVGLSYVLRLTFMPAWQAIVEALVLALVTVAFVDIAVSQSKTQISQWLETPDLMLDLAVILTLDLAWQIAFCISMTGKGVKIRDRIARTLTLYIPGLLIFPVSFYMLVQLIFSCPGMDFNTIGYTLGGAIAIVVPSLAMAAKYLLPEKGERLELIFYISCIIGLLGVISTVNGRTATTGTNEVNYSSLLAIFAIAVVGASCGYLIFLKKQTKRNKQS